MDWIEELLCAYRYRAGQHPESRSGIQFLKGYLINSMGSAERNERIQESRRFLEQEHPPISIQSITDISRYSEFGRHYIASNEATIEAVSACQALFKIYTSLALSGTLAVMSGGASVVPTALIVAVVNGTDFRQARNIYRCIKLLGIESALDKGRWLKIRGSRLLSPEIASHYDELQSLSM
jgi:hypothetical protein